MLPLTLLLLPVTVFGCILDTACLTQSPTGNPVGKVDYHGVLAGFDSDGDLSYRRAASTRNYEKYSYPAIGSATCDDVTSRGTSTESCGYFSKVDIIPISLTGENEVTFAGDMVQLTYSTGNSAERKELRFGVFHCIASKGNQDAFSTLTIMSNEAVFKPSSFTITANLEDRVTIEMPLYTGDSGEIKWRHTWENVIAEKGDWTGNPSPVIAKVGLTDAGVYEAYTDNSDEELSGYIRLIVRGCRYNLWGSPSCQWTCPVCYNGGVCDDVTGTCICPPGFIGDRCERVCPRGFIGQQCDIDCSFVTGEEYCQGIEICLPDPFGCTCAPGYSGLDCNSECDDGYYGAGCTQLCHCANGSCDPRTGECNHGTCESSWAGPMCQVKVLDAYGFGFPAAVNTNENGEKNSDIKVITTLTVDDNTQLRLGRETDAQTGSTGSGVSNEDVSPNIPSNYSGLPDGNLTFSTNLRGGNGLQLRSENNDLASRGIFYAEVISSQRREHIAILRMSNQVETSKTWTGTVAPNQYTWTVGTSESVTMNVTVSEGKSTTDLVWRHNGNIILEASGKDYFTIQTARKSDEGVYECFLQNETAGFQAMMLLKVRSCPSGKWGVHCNNTCPVCYYQGICHDETGECVCQAGYKGNNCSEICGVSSNDQLDLFGQSCSLRCGSIDRCRYRQICSPDPIGCHCRAGFDGGVRCHEFCSFPNFGPDCSMVAHCDNTQYDTVKGCDDSNACEGGYVGQGCQELSEGQNCPDGFHGKLCDKPCHCANSITCDRNTGSCNDSMCAEGWGGSDCDNALPYLSKSPVTSIVDNEVRVSWELWRIGKEYGTGPVSMYLVNYSQNDETVQARQSVMSTPSSIFVSGYAVELVGLNPLEEYAISVSPVKVIDGVETAGPSSPSTNVTSACGKPYFSPTIQNITSPSGQVLIVDWQITNPPRLWMNCIPSIRVFYVDIGGQEQDQGGFDTSENEIKLTGLESCITYNVSLAVEYQNGKVGVRSDSQTAFVNSTDPTVTPDQPIAKRLNGTDPVELLVSWTPIAANLSNLKCDPSTGFFYVVKWQLSSGDMNMHYSDDINENESTFTIRENLLQCSEYAVTVGVKNAAANVGPDSDVALVRTDSDDPTAIATNLRVEKVPGTTNMRINVSWQIEEINQENLKCDPDNTEYNFKVYYRPKDDVSNTKTVSVPGTSTTKTIEDNELLQCTSYEVYVTLKNVVGRESNPSSVETVVTESEDVTLQPIVHVTSVTETSISLSWELSEEPSYQSLKCNYPEHPYTFVVILESSVGNETENVLEQSQQTFAFENLTESTSYKVFVMVRNFAGRMGPAGTSIVTTDDTPNPLAIALGVTMPLLLLLVLVFLLYFLVLPKRRNKKKAKNYAVGLEFKGYVHNESSKRSDVTTQSSSFPSNETDREQNTCIPVKELPKYVKAKKISEAGFEGEYEKLLQGNYMPSEVGTTEANKEKNRFKNIVTYDHSRVKLPIINDDPTSDYINASYIHGYKRRNAFIASQGPNKASLEDFWRMIWHEGCRKIIMVTNLTEAGKVKCMKYWPDVKKTQTYFDMDVRTSEEKRTHQLVTRRFTITKSIEIREITQFHFIGWPDMKVPQSADVLWDMLDEAEKDETAESPPVVVHCSAGCGRTGTVIALSSLRKMMKAENKVDVFKFVNDMRKQRTTMVQVCAQYQFIFESLLMYSQVGKPSVKVDEYETTLRRWKSSQNSKTSSQCQMNKQFNVIKYVSPFPKQSEELAGSLPQNIKKNRYPELIPLNRFRPNLMTEVDGEDATNYINASFCDGHNKRDQFLSTQIPLSNTVVDFWRMVYDYECFTIVMFEAETNPSCADFWPSQGRKEYYGPFIVTTDEQETENDITRRNFRLSMNGKNSSSDTKDCRVITQYSLQHSKVLSKSAILSLVESVEMHERQHEGKRIVVQCLDGVRESSMFMAIYHCCERIRDDGIVDLFTVVRGLRERRPEMIGTMDQYEFCLDAIKERLATANVYANI